MKYATLATRSHIMTSQCSVLKKKSIFHSAKSKDALPFLILRCSCISVGNKTGVRITDNVKCLQLSRQIRTISTSTGGARCKHQFITNKMMKLNKHLLGKSLKVNGIDMACFHPIQGEDGSNHVTNIRLFSTHRSTSKTYYYDILGITPRATQSQIKNSFYKLSKVYHPDSSSDSSDVELFQAISEAYEVLGNRHKRRLYDRGVLNPFSHPSASGEHSETREADFQSKEGFRARHRHAPTGRTDAYNFDKFYRQHYGDQRRKKQTQKLNKDHLDQETEEYKKNSQMIVGCLLGVLIGFATFFLTHKR